MKTSKETKSTRSSDTSEVLLTEMKTIRREIRRLRKYVTALSEELATKHEDLTSNIDDLQDEIETLTGAFYDMRDGQVSRSMSDVDNNRGQLLINGQGVQ